MSDMITRYRPTAALERLHDAYDRLIHESFVLPPFQRLFDGFNRIGSTLVEKEDVYVLQVALPGIDYENADIRVVGNQLTIKGRYVIPASEDGAALWSGMPQGEFSEMLRLPAEVKADAAEAVYDRGILTLTLPKSRECRAHAIKVKTAA